MPCRPLKRDGADSPEGHQARCSPSILIYRFGATLTTSSELLSVGLFRQKQAELIGPAGTAGQPGQLREDSADGRRGPAS